MSFALNGKKIRRFTLNAFSSRVLIQVPSMRYPT